jgi:DNA polymerase
MTCLSSPEQLACTSCRLHQTRRTVVPGHGDPNATIALVGEAPGVAEDATGEPFLGRAGQRLDQLLSDVGASRADLWVTNVIRCRPVGNAIRSYPDAVATCPGLWLATELASLTNLKVIVLMGATAGALFLPGLRAKELAQTARALPAAPSNGKLVVGAYHPSYALREGPWVSDSIRGSLRRAMTYAALLC